MGSICAGLRGLGTAQDTQLINQGVTVAGATAGVAAGAGLLTGIGITATTVPFVPVNRMVPSSAVTAAFRVRS